MGVISADQRDFEGAEKWFQKSLRLAEKQGNDYEAALTYHELGIIAERKREFDIAEKWFQKALDVQETIRQQGIATSWGE